MPGPIFFDQNMQMLQKVLDLRQQNQQVISSNIANADTPGYRPGRLEFEKELASAMQTPNIAREPKNPKHFPIQQGPGDVTGKVTHLGTVTADGKSAVSVDQEMVALAQNEIIYETATQVLSKKLALLKYVSMDGK
jgi:flagellar basal-body rod protein FlgB